MKCNTAEHSPRFSFFSFHSWTAGLKSSWLSLWSSFTRTPLFAIRVLTRSPFSSLAWRRKKLWRKRGRKKHKLTVSRLPILTSWQLALLPCSHLAATGRQSTCALLLFTKSLAHICLISHIQALKSRCMFWSRLIRTLPRGGMYLVVHPRWPRVISRAEGNLEVGCTLYNPIHPDLRQCMAIILLLKICHEIQKYSGILLHHNHLHH